LRPRSSISFSASFPDKLPWNHLREERERELIDCWRTDIEELSIIYRSSSRFSAFLYLELARESKIARRYSKSQPQNRFDAFELSDENENFSFFHCCHSLNRIGVS
jgi:hypothetical protein